MERGKETGKDDNMYVVEWRSLSTPRNLWNLVLRTLTTLALNRCCWTRRSRLSPCSTSGIGSYRAMSPQLLWPPTQYVAVVLPNPLLQVAR